jgi:hypothetical protein
MTTTELAPDTELFDLDAYVGRSRALDLGP